MAYQTNGVFSLPNTVSYLPNNLSCLDNRVATSKFHEVFVSNVSTGETTNVSVSTKTSIHQSSIVHVRGEVFLIVASSSGTHIYMNDFQEMMFFLPIGVSCSENSEEPAHACGIASNNEEGFVFTGTSTGNITVIQVPSGGGDNISFHSALPTNDFPICCLDSSSEIIASGNDNGDIFAFSAYSGQDFARKCKFNGSGYPCTSIGVQGCQIFSAFSLGNIRVYNTVENEIKIEVTAHARCIYGLKLHPSLPILVTCSEDQHLHVWSTDNMDLLSTHIVKNRKLTGVAFFPLDEIGVSAYDSDEVALFSAV